MEELPKLIAKLEAEQQTITERLQDNNLYKTQPEEVNKLNLRYAEIDDLLLTSLEQWEAIEARSKE